jgi:hypothetical protein
LVQKKLETQCSTVIPIHRGNILLRRSQKSGPLGLRTLPLISPPTLLQNSLSPLRQHVQLPLLNALEPVTEATTHSGEEGVGPKGIPLEHGTHLDAELPKADGDACRK